MDTYSWVDPTLPLEFPVAVTEFGPKGMVLGTTILDDGMAPVLVVVTVKSVAVLVVDTGTVTVTVSELPNPVPVSDNAEAGSGPLGCRGRFGEPRHRRPR